MAINEDLADAYIDHRLDLLRFEAGVVRDLLAAYDGAYGDLLNELRAAWAAYEAGEPLSAVKVQALTERMGSLAADTRALYQVERAALQEALEVIGAAEVQAQARIWSDTVPEVGISWTRPALGDVLAAVDTPVGSRGWSERVATNLFIHQEALSAALGVAVARGSSMSRAAATLGQIEAFSSFSRSQLTALARTEIQRVANTAAKASYAANSDILDGVEYLATLDTRTCVVCAPLHGQTYPINDAPTPPIHPRCRCFLAPVVKSWAALGLGPAQADLFDGKPSGGPDFEAWLTRQPDKVATAILGPTRADAWRAGLPLESFSDQREPLTLDELRARYPDSF